MGLEVDTWQVCKGVRVRRERSGGGGGGGGGGNARGQVEGGTSA